MNKPNFDNDRDLILFLKQNQPIPPAPDPNLKALIMAQVANTAIASPINFKKLGLIGAAVITTITTLSFVIFSPVRPQTALNQVEVDRINNSLINNWHLPDDEFTTSYSLISSSTNP
jgi:hypothetical protein